MQIEEKKQRARENAKKYYQKNKEKILARQKKYARERYKNDEEYRKKSLERHKKYEKDNLEKVREIKRNAQKKYYQSHKDYYKNYNKNYNKSYKERIDKAYEYLDKFIPNEYGVLLSERQWNYIKEILKGE